MFRIVSASLNGVEAAFDLDGGKVSLVIDNIELTLSPTDDSALAMANEFGTQSILQRTSGGGSGGLGDSTVMSLSIVDSSNVDELLNTVVVEDSTPLDTTTQAKLQKIERDVAHMLERFSFRIGTVNVTVLSRAAAPPTSFSTPFSSSFSSSSSSSPLSAAMLVAQAVNSSNKTTTTDALHVCLRGLVYLDDDRPINLSADSPDDASEAQQLLQSQTEISPSVVVPNAAPLLPPNIASTLIRKRIAIQSIAIKARIRETQLPGITTKANPPDFDLNFFYF